MMSLYIYKTSNFSIVKAVTTIKSTFCFVTAPFLDIWYYSNSIVPGQFEYNTYIRDFFKDNKDRTLNDAIKCWKYMKSLPGHNRYDQTDLIILNCILPKKTNCSD